jgi:hypothetical protein
MKKLKAAIALAFVIVLVLGVNTQAQAQLEVAPAAHDFGDVEVGNSASTMVTVMNLGGGEEELNAAISGSAAFAITSNVPATIAPFGIVDIQVTFTPSAEGLAEADLLINGLLGSTLTGLGVAVEPPPSTSVADILEFFDASVADGTLCGHGPGKSANGRRNALRNQIEAAGDLIDDGADACQQLLNAYERCDGLSRPPEFVACPAAAALAQMILDLMADLGCP